MRYVVRSINYDFGKGDNLGLSPLPPEEFPSRSREGVTDEEIDSAIIRAIRSERQIFLAQGGEGRRMVLEGFFPEMDLAAINKRGGE